MAFSSPASLAGATTPELVRQQLRGSQRDGRGIAFRLLLIASLGVALVVLVTLLLDVLTTGWPVLSERLPDFLSSANRTRASQAGVFQALRGSAYLGLMVIIVAFPLGIAAAIWLEEYAHDTRLTRLVRVNIRNLAGVPSVVYGILGFTIFVKGLQDVTGPDRKVLGKSLLSGGLTLSALVLPIVIITASEAIRAVPRSLREAGYGVGATRWEVVRHHVLPYGAPGIITGTILALSRAVGEAAPLILVGAVDGRLADRSGFLDPDQIRERFTSLPILITGWARNNREGFAELAGAGIVVMLVFVLLANSVAIYLRNRFEKRRGG